jgi:uncharacterized protein
VRYESSIEDPVAVHVPRRGAYLDADAEGRLIKQSSLSTLDTRFLPPIADALRACQTCFGTTLDTVFVSGSVASGEAVPGESDLDMYVVAATIDGRQRRWVAATSRDIARRFPIASRVELMCVSNDQLAEDRELQQIFTLYAVCVYGRDMTTRFPPVVLGPWVAWRAATVPYDITDAISHLMRARSLARRRELCRWVMKRIVRAAFALVMERERRYTMALAPCYESFCKYYPEHRGVLGRVLSLATVPTAGLAEVLPVLTAVLSWMPGEASRVFGRALEDVTAEALRAQQRQRRSAVSFGGAGSGTT